MKLATIIAAVLLAGCQAYLPYTKRFADKEDTTRNFDANVEATRNLDTLIEQLDDYNAEQSMDETPKVQPFGESNSRENQLTEFKARIQHIAEVKPEVHQDDRITVESPKPRVEQFSEVASNANLLDDQRPKVEQSSEPIKPSADHFEDERPKVEQSPEFKPRTGQTAEFKPRMNDEKPKVQEFAEFTAKVEDKPSANEHKSPKAEQSTESKASRGQSEPNTDQSEDEGPKIQQSSEAQPGVEQFTEEMYNKDTIVDSSPREGHFQDKKPKIEAKTEQFAAKTIQRLSSRECLQGLHVLAFTSGVRRGGSDHQHSIEVRAAGQTKLIELPDLIGDDYFSDKGDLWKLSFKDDLGFTDCVTLRNLDYITIVAGSNDGWNIDSIVTYVCAEGCCREATHDFEVFQWIDSDGDPKHERFKLTEVY